jgi:large subunit ribosomal protein L7/L12
MANKVQKLIEEIEQLSVVELSEVVKALEEKFGVSAAAPVASATAPTSVGAGATDEPKEEQVAFTVVLANAGANKISVIKALREINSNLGLKEAKDLAEAAPKPILEGVNKATAEEAKKKLTDAGATVEMK